MDYFLNFLESERYVFHVFSSYTIAILILVILKTNSYLRNKRLTKKLSNLKKSNETKI